MYCFNVFLQGLVQIRSVFFRQEWSEQGVGHFGTNHSGARLPTDVKSTSFWLQLVNQQ